MKYDLTDFWQLQNEPLAPPEYRLLVAVLQRAVLDFIDYPPGTRHHDAARQYIFATSTEPFSVWWIFEVVFPEPQEVYDRFVTMMRNNPRRPPGVAFRVGGK